MKREILIPKERRLAGWSRGRNRSFSLAKLVVLDHQGGEIQLFGSSARPGKASPVILALQPVDAECLGVELMRVALTRGNVLHREETIRGLRMILDKLEGEDTGEFRNLIRDREDPVALQTTGLDRKFGPTGPGVG